MADVRIQSVKNIIARTFHGAHQELSFSLSVSDSSFNKNVEIYWSGEDEEWHILPAVFQYKQPHNREVWKAFVRVPLNPQTSIPGNIVFSARYECDNQVCWDNRFGANYRSDADSGLIVFDDVPLLHVNYTNELKDGELSHPVDVAVSKSLHPKRVTIHWTTDHWRTEHVVPCFFRHNHWDAAKGSNARNPNRYGWEIWAGRIPVHDAYSLEYTIECRTDDGVCWDNNQGENYVLQRDNTLRMMTLNLHCYQEENQDQKFAQIAQAIQELNVDIICLQEVAENWNDGNGDWASNAARIINEKLPTPYALYTDWSHLGFDKYREGVALLSKHDFLTTDSGYVSDSDDAYDIHSRKVVMAQVKVPYIGLINVFSAHLSWPDDGFYSQFDRLWKWADKTHDAGGIATLIGGDFNIKAGSEAYGHIVNTHDFEDQYLKATAPHAFERIFKDRSKNFDHYLGNDYRIDYIFLKKDSPLQIIDARELFTENYYGRVSDHTGYYVEFVPR